MKLISNIIFKHEVHILLDINYWVRYLTNYKTNVLWLLTSVSSFACWSPLKRDFISVKNFVSALSKF
jgi:hypothetical protein